MAILLHPHTSLLLPSRAVAPSRLGPVSRPQTAGTWLLTAFLLLLLIVGRQTSRSQAAHATAAGQPGSAVQKSVQPGADRGQEATLLWLQPTAFRSADFVLLPSGSDTHQF